ncbi:alpha-galactosidase [Clostridium baratii]|uniref:alpha-galactosidase n=1 Tax=Clostridium baratii TaxID=1561 RepID=UPI0009A2FD88|nr:alpha-galactosidase [Clostridium baratii]OPF51395.1 alpha-galactosidase [Clostridium baratii]OPF55532.1 alpha-galactosidase [Clostridium baratii]OPF57089.1 alpha-galactosidase [Clostridium baratii]OPF60087.1 alpha-galactosidase [Clostridium baratii]
MGIIIDKSKKIFNIQSKNTSYVFGVDNEGLLRHLYWGKKIEDTKEFDMPILVEVSTNDPVYEITKEEYPVYGSLRYKEHCLKATFADRSRELVYKYDCYEITDNELVIKLKDAYYEFNINLHYKVYDEYDLIERYVSIKNNSKDIIEIEKIHSGQLHIPYEDLNFSNVHGHWGAEQQRFVQKVNYGKIVIENRRGISSHNHNPYFILDKNATETTGEVFFGALKLSGNFSGIIEQTQYGETLVQMGINSHDFLIKLKPGEEFVSPAIIAGYSNYGFEVMTHNLHNFAKDNILREGLRPVLYNSWEATEFKVNCDEQINLAKKAKEIGAELFVVDDGWFGERDGIDNGLGDWYVNKEKFPNGLEPLIKEVKAMDMMFGIWVEPEMVNPLSQLYKDHPEWIYQFATRESDTSRGQYVLDLTKKEVKEYIYNILDELLSTYEIDYIKWDANRPISQTNLEKDVWYKHIKAVYDIVRELKVKHQNVLFEACASGGGRIDYGILGIFDDFWTSDNTDAYDRLLVQESYSYIYPIKAMRAWVTDCPNFLSRRVIPLRFRYHSAMMGTLGIGCNILKFNEDEVKLSQELIEEYKEIRHIIQDGDFYRLENTSKNNYNIYQYNKDNESLLFVFLPQSVIGHRGVTVKLRGLNSKSKYLIKINGEEVVKSGSYLMNRGLDIKLSGDYCSDIIRINRI